MQIAAGEFKAKCLKIMSEVQTLHQEVIITKFGKPIAKLVPVEKKPAHPLFGTLRGSAAIIREKFTEPIGEAWEADEQTH